MCPLRADARPAAPRTLTIELLAVDLSACGRCAGTSANLDAAVRTVASRLRDEGVAVVVRKLVVRTAAEAEAHRLTSSPTIRVDGRDIAGELRESGCGDCGELCGCDGGIDCRVWVWEGREHVEAPPAMIVDAILRAARAPTPSPAAVATAPFRLPANLRRFFDGTARRADAARAGGGGACCGPSPCCGPE